MVNAPKSLTVSLGCLGLAGALLTLATGCYSLAWLQSRARIGGWGTESLTISPDGRFVTGVVVNYESGYRKGCDLWIWDAQTGKRLSRHKLKNDGSWFGVQFSPSGRFILCGSTLYAPTNASPVLTIPSSNFRHVFSPDEKRLLVLSSDGFASDTYITAWDISGQRQLWQKRSLPGHWLENLTLPEQGGFAVRYQDRSELWTTDSSRPKRFPPTHGFMQSTPVRQSLPDTFQNRRVVASLWSNALKHEPIGRIVDSRTGATLANLEGTTGW